MEYQHAEFAAFSVSECVLVVSYLPVRSVKEAAVLLDCLDPVILSRTYCKNRTSRGTNFLAVGA